MPRHRVTTRWHVDSAVSEVELPNAAPASFRHSQAPPALAGSWIAASRQVRELLLPGRFVGRYFQMYQALIEGVEIAFGPSTPAPPPAGKCYSQAFFEGMKLCVYGQLKAS